MRQKNVGQTAWRPYAPTGMTRHDDDDDDFLKPDSPLLPLHALLSGHR